MGEEINSNYRGKLFRRGGGGMGRVELGSEAVRLEAEKSRKNNLRRGKTLFLPSEHLEFTSAVIAQNEEF